MPLSLPSYQRLSVFALARLKSCSGRFSALRHCVGAPSIAPKCRSIRIAFRYEVRLAATSFSNSGTAIKIDIFPQLPQLLDSHQRNSGTRNSGTAIKIAIFPQLRDSHQNRCATPGQPSTQLRDNATPGQPSKSPFPYNQTQLRDSHQNRHLPATPGQPSKSPFPYNQTRHSPIARSRQTQQTAVMT